MSSTFTKIVKAQGIDTRPPRNRRFTAKAIYELAHRVRANTLRGPAKLTLWQRFKHWLNRLVGRRVV